MQTIFDLPKTIRAGWPGGEQLHSLERPGSGEHGPLCHCGKKMVLSDDAVLHNGTSQGEWVWLCPNFPRCHGSQTVRAAKQSRNWSPG